MSESRQNFKVPVHRTEPKFSGSDQPYNSCLIGGRSLFRLKLGWLGVRREGVEKTRSNLALKRRWKTGDVRIFINSPTEPSPRSHWECRVYFILRTCSFCLLCHFYPTPSRNSFIFCSFCFVFRSSYFSGGVFFCCALVPGTLALDLPTLNL